MLVNTTTNLSYNFKTPDTDSASKTVVRDPKFPSVETIASASASTVALALVHPVTIVEQEVETDMAITVTAADPLAGDILILKLDNYASAAKTVTFSTGFTTTKGTLKGRKSVKAVVVFIYDGSSFVEVSRSEDIDTEIVTSDSAATVALVVTRKVSIVEQAVGADMTINLTAANAAVGDRIILKLNNDGTIRAVTFGTGFAASAGVTGTASKTIVVNFVYDGTRFVETGRTAAMTIS